MKKEFCMMNAPLTLVLSATLAGLALPASAESFPLDELGVDAMSSGWGRPQAGKSVDGNRLSVGGVLYDRGVGTHAPSEMTLVLGGKGREFRAKVGMDDEAGLGRGRARFRVYGDGRLLAESADMVCGDAAVDIKADVTGVDVMTLSVDTCGSFEFDHSDWLEAVVVMENGASAPVPFEGENDPVASRFGDFAKWAPTPPMGWNSWDCYGSYVNEGQFKANAKYMAEHLLKYGYEYAVVDIRWTVQNEDLRGYNQRNPVYTLDAWGRYVPAPERFPSSADGKGFKPLADFCHELGLKFGIHIMRGVPKEAVARKMPVKGANGITCDRITNGKVECRWLRDNCTVLKNRIGAQKYYDSIFELYASWGVDFVKVDDLSAPYHGDEIEMIRRAIDKCGRKIVFSTSPGETPLASGDHLQKHANMWRMVNDVWDSWGHIEHLVPIACQWLRTYPRAGTWPDCDMIPLGKLGVTGHGWSVPGGSGRKTNLTADEQKTLMNFFAICRSPLFIGADLPQLDADTLALLTDATVLAAVRDGRHPRPLSCTRDECVIESDNAKGGRFLAFFNLSTKTREIRAAGVSRVLSPHASEIVVLSPLNECVR